MQRIENFKRGDTFALLAALTDEAQQPLEIDVANLKSQVRDWSDALITELIVTTTETTGTYLLAAGSTAAWPANSTLFMDIQLNVDGQIRSSETIEISVVKDVTQ